MAEGERRRKSEIENLELVVSTAGFAAPRKITLVNRDRFDHGEDLPSRSQAEGLTRTPGHSGEQVLVAEAELHLESAFFDRDQPLDPSR